MTTSPTSSTPASFSGLGRAIDAYIVVLAVLAVSTSAIVGWFESSRGFAVENVALFVIISVLLIITEAKSTAIVRHVTGGVVTPSWAFAFTLILLGSPSGAILVMAGATVLADSLSKRPLFKIVFNVAQISLSLALGGLVLMSFGVHGPLFAEIELPTSRAIAMIFSGIVVFGINGIIVSRLLAWIENAGFIEIIRGRFLLSMTSDAAMLAIAPIFLITAKNNLLMLPLMGTATFFVYQTAQNALRRTHEANHDPLTGLLNRRAFNDQLEDFFAAAHPDEDTASVWILDLDRFKEVNDRLGHQTGDHVLREFATRLVAELPPTAVVARLGGDEFAVMITGTSAKDVEARARAGVEALARPLTVDGFPISTGTSIGVAHYPAHGRAQAELLHAADVAMYRAKRFRSGMEVYRPVGEAGEKGRITLLGDVADGLERGDFTLEYQPQFDVATGWVTAVEALLRWDHPKHGRIGPGEFVSLAEHTELIGPLTEFVVARAVDEVGAVPALRVAINVSARNLEDRHFASWLLAQLDERDFPTERLEVEITESALANDPERTSAVLEELRSAGVWVSIDDFGTGYASFGTLRDLQIDRVKIDRSLVGRAARSPADRHIVKAMIDLAHGLGLDVVAEGVETIDVWDALVELGCDDAQGFLMARPRAASHLGDLVGSRFRHPVHQPRVLEPHVPIVTVPA